MARVRVAVIMGGRSSEHDISVASARSVVDALDPERYDVRAVEIGQDGRWQLEPAAEQGQIGKGGEMLPVPADGSPSPFEGVDVVFPVLHGPFGEDGTVQGFLELADVAYVGAGVTASALCMDKDLFKAVMRDKGVPVVDSVTVLERHRDRVENPFGFPVVVKPARLGSSVGISIVKEPAELGPAIDLALEHDEKILLEEFIAGVEVECSVLGNEEPIASIPGEIVPLSSDWYDFSAKYDEGGMELVVPATPRRADDRQGAGAGRRRLRRERLRGYGPRRLLRPRERGGGRERAEHDSRLHGDERLREAIRGLGDSVRRAPRPLVELALERRDRRARLKY